MIIALDCTFKPDASTTIWQQRMYLEARETNALLKLVAHQGAKLMSALDAVTRIESKVDEVVTTLRELAALARAGGSLAEIEQRLNAAADRLGAAEDETDPTPDSTPPVDPPVDPPA